MTKRDFEILFVKYHKPLIYFCGNRLIDKQHDEDIVSGIMVKLYERIQNFSTEDQVRQWLYKCVKNDCIDANKHTRIENKAEVIDDMEIESDENIERTLIKTDLLVFILEDIRKSPPQVRKVMELIYSGFSTEEISKKLKISVDTVRTTKKRFIDDFSKPAIKKTIRQVTINGVTKSLSQWCKETDTYYWVASQRIERGATGMDIFYKEEKKTICRIMLHFNGRVKSLRQWCQELDIPYATAMYRYHKDLPAHQILSI